MIVPWNKRHTYYDEAAMKRLPPDLAVAWDRDVVPYLRSDPGRLTLFVDMTYRTADQEPTYQVVWYDFLRADPDLAAAGWARSVDWNEETERWCPLLTFAFEQGMTMAEYLA